jgi:hypothetical protein
MTRLLIVPVAALLCTSCVPSSSAPATCLELRASTMELEGRSRVYIQGEILNNCGVKLAIVEADFNIMDQGGAQIESIQAVTRNLDAGTSWKFKTMPTTEIPDDRGAVHFKVGKLAGYEAR